MIVEWNTPTPTDSLSVSFQWSSHLRCLSAPWRMGASHPAPAPAIDIEAPPNAAAASEPSIVLPLDTLPSTTSCNPRSSRDSAASLPPLFNVPSLKDSPGSSIVRTFLCQICLSDEDLQQAFGVQTCGHMFCRQCLSAYLTSKIR